MKTNKIYFLIAAALVITGLSSCNKFLDKNPDNRATIDTEEKVVKLVSSAYMTDGYPLIAEFLSDNIDEDTDNNTRTDRFVEQLWNWEDITESNNESPERFWGSAYMAIANANAALKAIEELGGPGVSSTLAQAYGEALVSRAYHHFMLLNLFAKNYNTATSASDLGITYMVESEHTLNPQYERNSVKECYELIEKDLEEGLPYVGDDNLEVPKYHFNRRAAYAFAARFYLFYEKWDKAIECADECLGSAPATLLRDYVEPASNALAIARHYIDASQKSNFLLFTAYSRLGLCFGGSSTGLTIYVTWAKYSCNNYLGNTEIYCTQSVQRNVWGTNGNFVSPVRRFTGTNNNKQVMYKLPYLFEYTDPVAGIGYNRTVYPALWADETLLVRAEAKILKKDYDGAVEDLNTWLHNITTTTFVLTKDNIVAFYNRMNYATWNASTPKKHLHPAFEIDAEGSDQEAMLQFLLHMRRIETAHLGLRWFDVKRYGIEIWRRQMNASGNPQTLKDVLTVDDERRAVQIPQKVVDAGYQPNPRPEKDAKDTEVTFAEEN